MPWNWKLPNWPQFTFDPNPIVRLEKDFFLGVGSALAYLKTIEKQDYGHFIVEILSLEGLESSRIEGESLDRESLQSSIKRHFGLQVTTPKQGKKESAIAEILCDVYESFDQPLSHEMLWKWHSVLFKGSSRIEACGAYRTHSEPMQIVSGRYDDPILFFEAPPSAIIFQEMTRFIAWFNESQKSDSLLTRAAIAHIYFESIHPFEDGNGRIGRLLVGKILSQGIGRPALIAVSMVLEKKKRDYYASLEKCNRTLDVDQWVQFFSSIILQAHQQSLALLSFLIEKSKMLNALAGKVNPRQTKVLIRMFQEGPEGFKGGFSAENYIAITKTTRATATRDLTDLVEKEALVRTGERRHTRYYLNLISR